MSKIPLKYHKKVLFYTKYTHPTLICRGTDARTENIYSIQYSGISSCSLGSTDTMQHTYFVVSAERGAETWGFHESPSYPHMFAFGLERKN
jgi:hypothetical protein